MKAPRVTGFPSSVFDLAALSQKTSLQHVEYHDEIDSTNTLAAELLQPLLQKSPALVLTPRQTAGRGRKGNSWHSSEGALTFSLVVKASDLPIPPQKRSMIALLAGYGVRSALSRFVPHAEFQLKWPNDVLTGSQKVCGILVEQHGSESMSGIIVGIGVNVNNSLREAPTEVAQRATSLFDLTGESFDLTEVLIAILQELDQTVSQYAAQPRLILSRLNHCSLLSGRFVTVLVNDQPQSGQCLGIDDDGCLVLQNETGLIRCTTGIVQSW